MNREVLRISLSAFFADLGYQTAVVLFPLILVIHFGVPIWLYGVVEAVNYGVGSSMGFLGGWAGDLLGRKRVAVVGNALIMVISLLGFVRYWWEAFLVFMVGWWARNFRTPPRRAMLTEVTEPSERGRAFGILHALDIAGATLSILYTAVFLLLKVPIEYILVVTAVPLAMSTVVLAMVNAGGSRVGVVRGAGVNRLALVVIVSTFFFGFSQYSFGFPVITTAQFTREDYLAVLGYGVFLVSSAVFGYVFGRLRINEYLGLAMLGYLVSSAASVGLALLSPMGILGIYPMVALLGVAVASAEVFEPTIISRLIPGEAMGSGMGLLTFGRSMGIFLGNTTMGLLYQVSYTYAYLFAAASSLVAFLMIIIVMARRLNE